MHSVILSSLRMLVDLNFMAVFNVTSRIQVTVVRLLNTVTKQMNPPRQ